MNTSHGATGAQRWVKKVGSSILESAIYLHHKWGSRLLLEIV